MNAARNFVGSIKSNASAADRGRVAAADAVMAQQRVAARARLARRITPILLQWLHIPPDESTLVAWLADLGCRCNRDAVQSWIVDQLDDPDLDSRNEDVLVTLASRLQRRLVDVEGALL